MAKNDYSNELHVTLQQPDGWLQQHESGKQDKKQERK